MPQPAFFSHIQLGCVGVSFIGLAWEAKIYDVFCKEYPHSRTSRWGRLFMKKTKLLRIKIQYG